METQLIAAMRDVNLEITTCLEVLVNETRCAGPAQNLSGQDAQDFLDFACEVSMKSFVRIVPK